MSGAPVLSGSPNWSGSLEFTYFSTRARLLRGQRLQFLWQADFFPPVSKQTALHIQKSFKVAAITRTLGTHVQDNNLKGRKLEIVFSFLFDQISYLVYDSFCLRYQYRLKDIVKKNCEVGIIPCTCVTYVPENSVKLRFQLKCFLFTDWWVLQTEMLHHLHNNKIRWFWVFWTMFLKTCTKTLQCTLSPVST